MTRTTILGLAIRSIALTSCRTASPPLPRKYRMGNCLTTYSRGPEWCAHIFCTVHISDLTYFSSEDTHILTYCRPTLNARDLTPMPSRRSSFLVQRSPLRDYGFCTYWGGSSLCRVRKIRWRSTLECAGLRALL